MNAPPPSPGTDTCVLCSGGLDSVVLLAWAAAGATAHPVYVRAGLAWEGQELAVLERALASAPLAGRVRPLAVLDLDVRDLYPPGHWALRGEPPAYDTPDEDVFLPGRNVLLLAKSAVLATSRGVGTLAIGPLAGNPFPDATPEFFEAMGRALSLGLAHGVQVVAPFATLHKADVIRVGVSLGVPLDGTLSCMNPRDTVHCGTCSKCRERRDAFAEAGVEDRTCYRSPSPRIEG
jgi:7-cyano-7-deazaguanine synthase